MVYLGQVSTPVLGVSCAARPHKQVPRVSSWEADGAGSYGPHGARALALSLGVVGTSRHSQGGAHMGLGSGVLKATEEH